MIKLILLLSLFLSISAFANYAKISEVESGNVTKVFLKESSCGQDCVNLPKDFNSSYSKIVDEKINDLEKPIYTNELIEACVDIDDCDAKSSDKLCPDGFQSYQDNQRLEVSCRRLDGYEQKLSGRKIIDIDEIKKAQFDADKAAKEQAKSLKRSKINEIKAKLKSNQQLTESETREALLFLLNR